MYSYHVTNSACTARWVTHICLAVALSGAFQIDQFAWGEDIKKTAPSEHPAAPRIIALAPNAAEIICGLGALDTLVGVSRFCTYPPQLESVPKIGGLRDPDLESIIGLNPTLMILRGQSPAVRSLCKERGIAVYDDQVESLEDLYRTIKELGDIVGRPRRATMMAGHIRGALKNIEMQTNNKERRRVLVTLRSPSALANVLSVGGGTFLSELVQIAGGHNIFADQDILYPSVSLEEIVGRNPEVIIEAMSTETLDDKQSESLMKQWQQLGPISAVQTKRIHFVTESYFTIPSQRVVQTANDLLSMIHPERRRSE